MRIHFCHILALVTAGSLLSAAVGEEPIPADKPGMLAGRVLFEGTVPPPRVIQVNKDQNICQHAAGEVHEAVVSSDKGLAGVVVEIQGIQSEAPPAAKPGADAYVIRQKGCRFIPSLLVVPDGAVLSIYNDDPTLHNINSGQFNVAQPDKSDRPIRKKIAYDGQSLLRVNCDVHSWMEMWLYVARSPFHATTDTDGRFKIENVPPGSYKVTAIHPTLGTEKFKIKVAGGETTEHVVTFRSE